MRCRAENRKRGHRSQAHFRRDGATVSSSDFGWYQGVAKRCISREDEEKTPSFNFWVCFKSSETSDVSPACSGLTAKSAHADYALGLIPSSRAVDYKWVLLKTQVQSMPGGGGAGGGGGGILKEKEKRSLLWLASPDLPSPPTAAVCCAIILKRYGFHATAASE